MAKYAYVGVKNKKTVKGEIEASSEDDAKKKLRKEKILPTRVYLPLIYDDVQFISYQVNTFPNTDNVLYLGPKPYNFDGVTYHLQTFKFNKTYFGDADSKKDIDNRCELVKNAIETAEAHAAVSKDEKCLKLFMMPEFYFRGSDGAYSLDDYQNLIDKLRNLVQNEDYKHWLFVFGTILACFEPLKIETEGSRGKMEGSNAILNTVLVQKGAAGEEKSCVIVKDVMSNIDFPKQKELTTHAVTGDPIVITRKKGPDHLWDDEVDHLKSGKKKGWWIFKKWDANQKAGKETQVANYSGLGIFELEKITFGVEVCLDHALQRLKKSPPPKGDNWIQIQLIPSAGMDPEEDSVIARKEGWVFNCDGRGQTHIHEVRSDWKEAGGTSLKKEEKPVADLPIHTAGNIGQKFKESFKDDAHLKIFGVKPIPSPREAK